jgi:hypothetical protein
MQCGKPLMERNAILVLRVLKTLGYNTPTQRKTQRTVAFRLLLFFSFLHRTILNEYTLSFLSTQG